MTNPEGSNSEYQEFLQTLLPTMENGLAEAGVFQVLRDILIQVLFTQGFIDRFPFFRDKNFLRFLVRVIENADAKLLQEVLEAERNEDSELEKLLTLATDTDHEVESKKHTVRTLQAMKSRIIKESDAASYSLVLMRVLLAN